MCLFGVCLARSACRARALCCFVELYGLGFVMLGARQLLEVTLSLTVHKMQAECCWACTTCLFGPHGTFGCSQDARLTPARRLTMAWASFCVNLWDRDDFPELPTCWATPAVVRMMTLVDHGRWHKTALCCRVCSTPCADGMCALSAD
jgi:hypothetical protein